MQLTDYNTFYLIGESKSEDLDCLFYETQDKAITATLKAFKGLGNVIVLEDKESAIQRTPEGNTIKIERTSYRLRIGSNNRLFLNKVK